MIEHDAAASIVTGPDGAILCCNAAAQRSYNAQQFDTLGGALQPLIANPGALLFRLQTRAGVRGSAHEDVVTGTGHVRLSVHRTGTGNLLWRIEKSADLAARRSDAVPLPMLTVGRNNAVLFMNDAARTLIGADFKNTGQRLR
ncbi:hypothetical protein [Roseovarius dicentrarchi]|uniref:hypothetical protein n=1 Tax=Roseovarius dicentrarchi TaxID=2250573 RepID=UPI000DEABB8A|nr:hypothetical protein [Roseovarius dicentrarchi]